MAPSTIFFIKTKYEIPTIYTTVIFMLCSHLWKLIGIHERPEICLKTNVEVEIRFDKILVLKNGVDNSTMYIRFSSVHTDVLEFFLHHVHHEQLITEAATKTCSLEIAVHKFRKFNPFTHTRYTT